MSWQVWDLAKGTLDKNQLRAQRTLLVLANTER